MIQTISDAELDIQKIVWANNGPSLLLIAWMNRKEKVRLSGRTNIPSCIRK